MQIFTIYKPRKYYSKKEIFEIFTKEIQSYFDFTEIEKQFIEINYEKNCFVNNDHLDKNDFYIDYKTGKIVYPGYKIKLKFY